MKPVARSGSVFLGAFLWIVFSLLGLGGSALYVLAQTANDFEWRVQLAASRVAPSNVTATNDCKRTHSFQIQPDQLPFMRLLGDASFTVAPGKDHVVPVQFDTRNMKPGQYEALLVVKCMSCREEPTCRQDHTNLHVFLTVLPAGGIWSAIHPEQKGETVQNPTLHWANVSPERKPL